MEIAAARDRQLADRNRRVNIKVGVARQRDRGIRAFGEQSGRGRHRTMEVFNRAIGKRTPVRTRARCDGRVGREDDRTRALGDRERAREDRHDVEGQPARALLGERTRAGDRVVERRIEIGIDDAAVSLQGDGHR